MKSKASKRDVFMASLYTVAYMATLTYSILSLNGTLLIMASLLFAVVIYASYLIDRETKRCEREKQRKKDAITNAVKAWEERV